MRRKGFSIVSAVCESSGIGINNQLPWKISKDMKFFAKLTVSTRDPLKTNAVIMGRKTYESIPLRFRPLPNRLNVILTRSRDYSVESSEVVVENSLQNALKTLNDDESVENIFVIGGESLYSEGIQLEECEALHITHVYGHFECDRYFPAIGKEFFAAKKSERFSENNTEFQFVTYERTRNSEEEQYLQLIRDIVSTGVQRSDRTGTGTLAVFGRQMRFSLRNKKFPLLTTKRVFWRGVVEELLWFIGGSTNARLLRDKKVLIWEGNSTRAFLDKRGLYDREEGDLGPVYGFQWRHFGAEYETMHADYSGKGVDQLRECIELIKNNPNSRRILMSAWNPSDLHKMALPPCHILAQFFVANGELSCQMYQRSCDVGLGVPFNIASYALLTRIMAQAGEFVHVLGDAHVYLNHVEPLMQQVERVPGEFPTLEINAEKVDIEDFCLEDFTLVNYRPQKSIKMEMAV